MTALFRENQSPCQDLDELIVATDDVWAGPYYTFELATFQVFVWVLSLIAIIHNVLILMRNRNELKLKNCINTILIILIGALGLVIASVFDFTDIPIPGIHS